MSDERGWDPSTSLLREVLPSVPLTEATALAALRSRLFSSYADPIRIGRYTVGEVIGRGGAGVVVRAEDPELGRQVAIKLLRVEAVQDTDTAESMVDLLREAKTIAAIRHPNVVAVHDIGTYDESTLDPAFCGALGVPGRGVFVVMEYVPGLALDSWLQSGNRSVDEILAVFADAGRALAVVHAHGVVHRDFKPTNVLIDDRGTARVVDFGLARAGIDESARAGSVGAGDGGPLTAGVGTPRYMAPEQFTAHEPDARVDVYAFAASLYEALFQCAPFVETSVEALREAKRRGRIQVPARLDRRRRRIHRVLVEALSPQPDARPATMAELLERIDAAAHRSGRWMKWMGSVAAGLGGLAVWGVWPSAEGGACHGSASTPATITRPVDVIVVVDTSRSMASAIAATERSLNDQFATIMRQSDMDWRAIIVGGEHTPADRSICIGAPLGASDCAADPPVLRNSEHIVLYRTATGSGRMLDTILEALTAPDHSGLAPDGLAGYLRPEAFKIFLLITDGESASPLQQDGDAFDEALRSLAPEHFGSAPERNYVLHAILDLPPREPAAQPWRPEDPIVGPGESLQRLAVLTGGWRFALARHDDFDVMFDRIAQAVVERTPVSCTLPLEPGVERSDDLRLLYWPGEGAAVERFEIVSVRAACHERGATVDGDRVRLCEAPCRRVQADPAARLELLVGCD